MVSSIRARPRTAAAAAATAALLAATAALVAAPAAGEDRAPAVRGAQAAPQFLQLPPLVRLAGRPTARGARIRLLEVFAPPGATITVRCRGRSCPYRMRSTPVTRIRTTFKGFRRRRLAAGALVEVTVTAPGKIGKYAAFLIRRGKVPARVDLCMQHGALAPTLCPRLS